MHLRIRQRTRIHEYLRRDTKLKILLDSLMLAHEEICMNEYQGRKKVFIKNVRNWTILKIETEGYGCTVKE